MEEFDILVSELGQDDEQQVVKAAHSLGDLGDLRALPVLIHLLESTESHRIRNAAAIGLRELGDRSAIPALMKQINDPKNARDLGTLIYALEPLDARSTIIDLAYVVCAGSFECMQMVEFVIEAFKGPIDKDDKYKALSILKSCLEDNQYEDWQEGMMFNVIEALEAPNRGRGRKRRGRGRKKRGRGRNR